MHDLKDKNNDTIKLLGEDEQVQIENEIGKYIG